MLFDLLRGLVDRVRDIFTPNEAAQTLRDYMVENMVTMESIESRRFLNLMESLATLEQAVQEDIGADRREVSRESGLIWTVVNAFSLFRRGRQFNRESQQLIDEVQRLLREVRRIVEEQAEPKLHVPDQLKEVAGDWAAAVQETQAAQAQLLQVAVSNWQGPAATEYRTMAEVQINALREQQPMTVAMMQSYMTFSHLNAAVLSVVERSLRFAVWEVRGTFWIRLGDVGFYSRTNAWKGKLNHLIRDLERRLTISDSGSNSIGAQLTEVRDRAVLVAQRWPSGTAMAGTPAGDTNVTISATASQTEAKHDARTFAVAQGIQR